MCAGCPMVKSMRGSRVCRFAHAQAWPILQYALASRHSAACPAGPFPCFASIARPQAGGAYGIPVACRVKRALHANRQYGRVRGLGVPSRPLFSLIYLLATRIASTPPREQAECDPRLLARSPATGRATPALARSPVPKHRRVHPLRPLDGGPRARRVHPPSPSEPWGRQSPSVRTMAFRSSSNTAGEAWPAVLGTVGGFWGSDAPAVGPGAKSLWDRGAQRPA